MLFMEYVWYLVFTVLFIFLGFKLKDLYQFYSKKESKDSGSFKSAAPIESKTIKPGLQVDKLKEGTGPGATKGRHVTVHYRAFLKNGIEVDSSYSKGGPFEFTIGRNEVIPGWEMGMLGMKVGEVSKFVIAPEHAYGANGKGKVPPNAEIVFEVTLLKMH